MITSLGLIGAGNMGTAIVEGVLKTDVLLPSQVWVFDKVKEKASDFARQRKLCVASSAEEVLQKAEVVLLAVKPQDFKEIAIMLKSDNISTKFLISILAGMTIESISREIGASVKIVRAMPNLGAKVGSSVTALTSSDEEGLSMAEKIFSGCGSALRLEEKHFDLVTAVSGSGPAYFFYLMEHMMKAAQASGISKKDARELVVKTALGSALLAESSEDEPSILRERVTSKGGTTQAALDVLNQQAADRIIIQAVEAARKRGEELRK